MDENGIDGTMKKLFGNEIDCFTNDEFDGSNEESKISMEVVYATNVDNADKIYNEKIPTHSVERLSSMVKPYTSIVNVVDLPSRIVESFGQDIISSQYFTNVSLYSNNAIDGKDQKMDKQEISKFKYSSLEDIRKALGNQRTQESGSKRELNIHYILNRLRTYAFHLFVDVGWNVERRKVLRSRPEKRVTTMYAHSCSFKSPKGHNHNTLSGAWVTCGEELHSKLLHPRYDEIGKMWFNKHDFYLDMVYTITFVGKEEKALSPLLRWQLLDPFIAVVCIDKNVSTLERKGVALAAIDSKTYVVEIDSCSFGGSSLSTALVPTFEGKHENCEDDRQMSYDVMKNQSVRSPKDIDSNGGEEFFDAAHLKHQMRNILASNPETESRASENDGTSNKVRKPEHSTENDSPKLFEELAIKGSNVKRVLNFDEIEKPDNDTVELQEEESNNMLTQNVIFSRDPCNLSVNSQTHTMQQQQALYLHTSQNTPYFSRSHETNAEPVHPSFMNIPQTIQSLLYNVSWSDAMQQAVQPFTFTPMTMQQQLQSFPLQPNRSENVLVRETVNFREQSGSKKLKNQKRKFYTKSKKSSEFKAAEVNYLSGKNLKESFVHDVADENNIDSMNPSKKTICITSDCVESPGKSYSKARRMVVEDSFCFVEEDYSSINETYKSHTELELKSLKRDVTKMKNRFCREVVVVDTPLESNDIELKSCKIKNNGPFVSSSMKIKDPMAQFLARRIRSTNTYMPSLQTSEKCYTKHSKTIIGWLIDKGVILLNEVIQSINSQNKMLQKEGIIKRNGILCKCCDNLFCVSNFKSHASREGMNFSNLFVGYKKTYTLCQLEALSAEYGERKGSSEIFGNEYLDQNDDACALCGDGGNLVCCDGCPSSYHKSCLPSQELPKGSWYCHHCICIVCSDTMKEVESLISASTVTCQQCEQKYHQTCIEGKIIPGEEVGSTSWFCGEKCHELFVALHSSIEKMTSIGDGFYYTVLRCNHGEQKFSSPQEIAATAEYHAKLAVALTVMEESFVPMIDSRTSIQMIPHILYNRGSKFARLNYKGFYTVVLEREDEIICVASIRINGVSAAEIPLIATYRKYRHQGMCRRLMGAIEELLKFLKVELLVLSAIPKWVDSWISGFGYRRMDSKEKKRLINVNLVSFPGTVLLQKTLYEGTQDCVNSDKRMHVETAVKENEQMILDSSEMNHISEQSFFRIPDQSEMEQSCSTEQNLGGNMPAVNGEVPSNINTKNDLADPKNSECKSSEKTFVEVREITNSSDMKQLSSASDKTSMEISTNQLQATEHVIKAADI